MKITIVGAGIAGLVAKLALDRFDVSSELFEANAPPRSGGGALALQANALGVLERLDVRGELERLGTPLQAGYVVDERLQVLREYPKSAFGIAIPRALLHEVLLDRVGRDNVHFGKSFKSLTTTGQGVELSFEDGASASTDVLIGADGIRSRVRHFIAPETRLRYTGQSYFAGFSDYVFPEAQQHEFREAWGMGLKFGMVALGKGGVYWFACKKSAEDEQLDADRYQEIVAELFRDFSEPVGSIIQQAHSIFHSKIHDVAPTNGVWHDARTCLIGDAAHATTPHMAQGACQAIEDAYLLSGLLQHVQDAAELPRVFTRFKRARLDKVQRVVKMSFSTGEMSLYKRRLSIGLRNFILKHLPRLVTDRQIAKVLDMTYLGLIDGT